MVPELVEGLKGRRKKGERGGLSRKEIDLRVPRGVVAQRRASAGVPFRKVVGAPIILRRLTLHLVVPPPRLRGLCLFSRVLRAQVSAPCPIVERAERPGRGRRDAQDDASGECRLGGTFLSPSGSLGNAGRWPASEAGETPAFPGGAFRTIPACAGETPTTTAPSAAIEGYPRVCGGNPPPEGRALGVSCSCTAGPWPCTTALSARFAPDPTRYRRT